MNEERFDELTRRLANRNLSRRQVLKAFGASLVLTGPLGAFWKTPNATAAPLCSAGALQTCLREVDAFVDAYIKDVCEPRPKQPGFKDRFKDGSAVFSLGCIPFAQTVLRRNRREKCVQQYGCQEGGSCCGDQCVDTNNNSNNCGTCGNVCPSRQTCFGGSCNCPGHLQACGEESCCNSGSGFCETCSNGVCATKQCPGDKVLDKLTCQCACPPGLFNCSGDLCVDTNSDPKNCGFCGKVCSGSKTACENRTCVCPNQQTCSSPKVFNEDTCECECPVSCPDGSAPDPTTCECKNQCPPDQELCQGKCCPVGTVCCGGNCVPKGYCCTCGSIEASCGRNADGILLGEPTGWGCCCNSSHYLGISCSSGGTCGPEGPGAWK